MNWNARNELTSVVDLVSRVVKPIQQQHVGEFIQSDSAAPTVKPLEMDGIVNVFAMHNNTSSNELQQSTSTTATLWRCS